MWGMVSSLACGQINLEKLQRAWFPSKKRVSCKATVTMRTPMDDFFFLDDSGSCAEDGHGGQ